jgi:hypothetical protein
MCVDRWANNAASFAAAAASLIWKVPFDRTTLAVPLLLTVNEPASPNAPVTTT